MSIKLTVFSSKPYDEVSFKEALEKNKLDAEFIFQDTSLDTTTVALAQGSDAVVIFVDDICSAEVLKLLHEVGVKAVFIRAAGFNNVDLKEAKNLGIPIYRVPAYSPASVAEHAVALTMAVNRRIHRAYVRIREGNFDLQGLEGYCLSGKTVGIIGTGKIGYLTGKIFKGFDCNVIGYDPYPNDFFKEIGTYAPLDEVLEKSDVISLHCPLTPENKHIINSKTLSKMKKTAILINTSRGGLIDTQATVNALKSESLGALAIDVYENEGPLFYRNHEESPIPDDLFIRLCSFPNVIVTGHQGFFTHEALEEISQTTLDNIKYFLANKETPNQIKE